MHVSLSEVEAAVAKAVMGVRLAPGLGEDAGRAAGLMLRSGLGCFADLVGALDAVDSGASAGFDAGRIADGVLAVAGHPAGGRPDAAAGTSGRDGMEMQGRGAPRRSGARTGGMARLSALVAGPTACDLLAAAARGAAGSPRTVTLMSVDYPGVVLHLVLDASRAMKAAVRVAWSRDRCGAGDGRDAGARESGTRIEVVCQAGAVRFERGAATGALGAGPARMSIRLAEPISGHGAGQRGAVGSSDGDGSCGDAGSSDGEGPRGDVGLSDGEGPRGDVGLSDGEGPCGDVGLSDDEGPCGDAGRSGDTGLPEIEDTPGDDGQGGDIDEAVWRRLSAYAERQLVEGDTRSRLTGAGAGVIDTD